MDAIGSAACEENAACGRRLMAIAELYARRAPEEDVERINWAIDGHANVVAEISAAPNISPGRAAGQLRYAIDLRERLPKVAAVFAQWAPTWMKMSGPTLSERIDMWVATFDPHRGAGATPGARGPRWRDRPNQPRHGRDLAKLPLHKGAAPMPWARSPPARPAWHAAAATPSAPPQRRYPRRSGGDRRHRRTSGDRGHVGESGVPARVRRGARADAARVGGHRPTQAGTATRRRSASPAIDPPPRWRDLSGAVT